VAQARGLGFDPAALLQVDQSLNLSTDAALPGTNHPDTGTN
jgi:hypothetical protein